MRGPDVRIAIVYQESLLTEAVRSLLEGHADVTSIDLSEDSVAERLRALDPSVVIVDADDTAFSGHDVLRLLEGLHDVQLVCLHGGGDHLDVYRKTRVAVRGARDVAVAVGAS